MPVILIDVATKRQLMARAFGEAPLGWRFIIHARVPGKRSFSLSLDSFSYKEGVLEKIPFVYAFALPCSDANRRAEKRARKERRGSF